jgi:WhiB family transcriptional regulator, redox-sensing transcriptional regulator
MSSTSLVVLAGRAAELIGPLPCRTEDPQLWFSDLPAELEQAKAFCRDCPLRAPCLAGAIERAEPHGVWGGQIFDKGTLTAFKRTRGRPRKHPKIIPCAS